MPNTNVLTQAQLEAQMDDETNARNPDVNAVAGGRKIIHLTLVCDGVNVDIGDLFDSVATVGANVSAVVRVVGVTGEKSDNTRNTYIWNIGPV